MALLDNVQNLPRPVLYAGGAGAALGLLMLAVRKSKGEQNAPVQPASTGMSTPVYLPPGAAASNNQSDQINQFAQMFQQNWTAFSDAQAEIAASQAAANKAQLDQIIARLGSQGSNGASSPLGGGGDGDSKNPPVSGNGGQTSAPSPQPIQTPTVTSPVPTPAPSPVPAPSAPSQGIAAWETRTIRDLKPGSFIGGTGDAAQRILDWLQGSKAKIYAQFSGNDWISFGRAEAGWVDENIGLAIPVAYNGTHDYGVGDYTNESFYARWARKTINIMQSNPNLTQKEAGLMAASNLKRDITATGRNLYDGGFDFGSVPDNYGYGQTWR